MSTLLQTSHGSGHELYHRELFTVKTGKETKNLNKTEETEKGESFRIPDESSRRVSRKPGEGTYINPDWGEKGDFVK